MMSRKLWIAAAIVVLLLIARTLVHSPMTGTTAKPDPASPAIENSVDASDALTSSPNEPPGDKRGCLTGPQAEGSPAVVSEGRRRDPIETRGPAIDAFRNVPHADVKAQAETGDAAAMIVLATRLALRAQDKDPDSAIDVLEEYGPIVWPPFRPEGEPLALIEEANHWYYEAALHGRVAALARYAELQWMIEGTPFDPDWISQEDFDALSKPDQFSVTAMHAYQLMVYDLHPELRDGLLGVLADFIPDTPLAAQIRAPAVEKFKREREARGLKPAQIPPSVLSWDGVISTICASDFARILRETFEDD